jgi:amidase
MTDALGAFVSRFELRGAPDAPLSGRSFAAKDLFDVAGYVTGAGNPDWARGREPAASHAPVVAQLLQAGATLIGKTHTDEVSRGIFGQNAHYGTPLNPRAPGRVPGGSSSGSASAVAGGICDFALGTDTGGSVRVPASFCGLYGIRPTHGRIPLAGVVGQAPSFDTIGWLARVAPLFAAIGEVLLGTAIPAASTPVRILAAEDAFAVADPDARSALTSALSHLVGNTHVDWQRLSSAPLEEWLMHQAALQGWEAWRTFREWIDTANPRFSFDVADNFLRGASVSDAAAEAARQFRAARRAEVLPLLAGGTLIALPSAPFPAPLAGQPRSQMRELRTRILMLTCIAGTLGCPQVTLPLAEVDGLPVGLSLMAAPGDDARLLAFSLRT